jgi:hypothetical protein
MVVRSALEPIASLLEAATSHIAVPWLLNRKPLVMPLPAQRIELTFLKLSTLRTSNLPETKYKLWTGWLEKLLDGLRANIPSSSDQSAQLAAGPGCHPAETFGRIER